VFTIGQFARLAGVSAKVLRSYDRLGLFRPVWTDPSSGYRYYSPAQLPDVRRILALRDVGIGLAEIGRLVGGGLDLRTALDRRRVELEDEHREVERRLATLDIRVEMSGRDPLHPDVVVRPVPAEGVAMLRLDAAIDHDVAAAFYELETLVRDQGQRAHRPPGALVHPDGDVEIFVPIRRPIRPDERIASGRLPACRAATRPAATIHVSRSRRAAAMPSYGPRWMTVAAGPLRIIYLQFGAEPELRVPQGYVVDRAADFVTELQLPVV
jgi:DNA-binding transcriptional MerR regulator